MRFGNFKTGYNSLYYSIHRPGFTSLDTGDHTCRAFALRDASLILSGLHRAGENFGGLSINFKYLLCYRPSEPQAQPPEGEIENSISLLETALYKVNTNIKQYSLPGGEHPIKSIRLVAPRVRGLNKLEVEITHKAILAGWPYVALLTGFFREKLQLSDDLSHEADMEDIDLRLFLWFSQPWAMDIETTWYFGQKVKDHRAAFATIFGKEQSLLNWLPEDHPVRSLSKRYNRGMNWKYDCENQWGGIKP